MGLAPCACDALLRYLELCWAAAAEKEPAQRPRLGAEPATWLLELLCGLGAAACLGRRGHAFLPRPAAQAITQLPFLSHERTAADLAFHADSLARAGPEALHRLWRRLACMLAVTSEALAAGGGHDALLGRLALSGGALLASLAVRSGAQQGAKLPADVPGALLAALRSAHTRLPALQLQRLEAARSVGALVGALRDVAGSLGTALMQARGCWRCGGAETLCHCTRLLATATPLSPARRPRPATAPPALPATRCAPAGEPLRGAARGATSCTRRTPALPASFCAQVSRYEAPRGAPRTELREFDGFPRQGPAAALAALGLPFREAALAAVASSVRAPTLAELQVRCRGAAVLLLLLLLLREGERGGRPPRRARVFLPDAAPCCRRPAPAASCRRPPRLLLSRPQPPPLAGPRGRRRPAGRRPPPPAPNPALPQDRRAGDAICRSPRVSRVSPPLRPRSTVLPPGPAPPPQDYRAGDSSELRRARAALAIQQVRQRGLATQQAGRSLPCPAPACLPPYCCPAAVPPQRQAGAGPLQHGATAARFC